MGDIPALLYSTYGRSAIYPLRQANEALKDQRAWRFEGAAVLVP
jgi:hypothetical protein